MYNLCTANSKGKARVNEPYEGGGGCLWTGRVIVVFARLLLRCWVRGVARSNDGVARMQGPFN